MTIAQDILDAIYTDPFFTAVATLTVGAVVTYPRVKFTGPYRAVSPASGEIETIAPMARCQAADVATAVHGSTLAVGGVTYKVIGIQPSENGLEIYLILSED